LAPSLSDFVVISYTFKYKQNLAIAMTNTVHFIMLSFIQKYNKKIAGSEECSPDGYCL